MSILYTLLVVITMTTGNILGGASVTSQQIGPFLTKADCDNAVGIVLEIRKRKNILTEAVCIPVPQ